MPAPGTVIANRFEIVDLIAEGGMGYVYKARDRKLGCYAALKTLRDAANAEAIELFKKELAVLGNLPHPNIITITDFAFYADGGQERPYLAMPLLVGNTLKELIDDENADLSVERIVRILRDACRGLQAAHAKNVVHRDVKPSNIFVLEDDSVVLIDFGVVHLIDDRTTGGFKGTVLYMAPEQALGKAPETRTDLFSLGVVAYEALTRRHPFTDSRKI